MNQERYVDHIERLEADLGPRAFKSDQIRTFVDGRSAIDYYSRQWEQPEGRERLLGRTPLMLDRDRILYSDELRRLTDKYHILFQKSDRIIRNYTTHTLRMTHVARVVAGRLGLNIDLTEAISLGAKVGALPFIHVSKSVADEWLIRRIREVDATTGGPARTDRRAKQASHVQQALFQGDGEVTLPSWLSSLQDRNVVEAAIRHVPWAAGDLAAKAYTSGQESYWLLCTDPYLRRPRSRQFLPQTMFGVWQHSRGSQWPSSFLHRSPLFPDGRLDTTHSTLEGLVVQYADDITWAIENLNDANRAVSLSGYSNKLYHDLATHLTREDGPGALTGAIHAADSGGIYTYFIGDLVSQSDRALKEWSLGDPVLAGTGREPLVRLSSVAERMLDRLAAFLQHNVFSDTRVTNRNRIVRVIAEEALDILADPSFELISQFIRKRGREQAWSDGDVEYAIELVSDDVVHRLQLAVDIMVSMSDQEVYNFTGLESV